MAQTTKKAFAASLKKLLTQKPLNKITVTDLAEDCEVNRQTFYYHFQDIYALVEWIFTSETTMALDGKKTYDTWQQGFLKILEYVQENKAFVINTYHSISREHLERYLYNEVFLLLIGVIDEQAEGVPIRSEDKKFIADFYKYGFVGLTVEWIRDGMKENPHAIMDRLSILIQGDIDKALDRFRTDRHR